MRSSWPGLVNCSPHSFTNSQFSQLMERSRIMTSTVYWKQSCFCWLSTLHSCLVLYMAPRWFWSVQIIFGRVPIVWLRSNSFWSGPNHYGQVQIIRISLEKSNLNLTKILWPRPKKFGPNQNNLHLSKTICKVQNHFGPIEGQGIRCKSCSHE